MIQLDDIKVVGANVICMLALNVGAFHVMLEISLLLATIVYTLVRTANEIKRFRDGKRNNGTSKAK
jgi:hypothetical protein